MTKAQEKDKAVILGFIDAKIKTYSDRYIKSRTQKESNANARVCNAMEDLKTNIESYYKVIYESKI